MLIIRLMAVGPVVEGKAQRDVWFEVNGEVRAVSVEDKHSAVETVSREKATNDPGSLGAPMSGVVVEVRVKEGQEVKKGDPVCVLSAMKMESAVTAPVSGHVKRVVVQEGERLLFSLLAVHVLTLVHRRLHQPGRSLRRDCALNIVIRICFALCCCYCTSCSRRQQNVPLYQCNICFLLPPFRSRPGDSDAKA